MSLETGMGVGLLSLEASPHMVLSHSIRLIFFRKAYIYPFIGYYGIFSDFNGRGYQYNPNFGGGVRIGDSDRLAFQGGFVYYHLCCYSGRDPERKVSWMVPAFSLHIPLGKGHNAKQPLKLRLEG